MSYPPPLPWPCLSIFAWLALLAALLAAGAALWSERLGASPESRLPLRLALFVTGGTACAAALVMAVAALAQQRKAWLWPAFSLVLTAGAGIALGWQAAEAARGFSPRSGSAMEPAGQRGVTVAVRPVPQERSALTAVACREYFAAWGEVQLLQPWEKTGAHDPASDETARQLIRDSVDFMFATPNAPAQSDLRKRFGSLSKSARDPLLTYLAARAWHGTAEYPAKLDQAVAEVEASGYPPAIRLLVRGELFDFDQAHDRPTPAGLSEKCVADLREALAEKPPREGDYWAWRHLLGTGFLKRWREQAGEDLCGAVESVPGVESWFRLWLRGEHEIRLAWRARGNGYANSVTEDGWKAFGTHLGTARQLLEQGRALHPRHPALDEALMEVALGEGGAEEIRQFFDEAVRIRFDYLPVYKQMRWGLRARWYGGEAALIGFGRACLETGRFETQVPWQLLESVKEAAEDSEDAEAYYRDDAPWPDLEKMFRGYVEMGAARQKNYALTVMAIVADKCGKTDARQEALTQLGYRLDPRGANEWKMRPGWAEAFRPGGMGR